MSDLRGRYCIAGIGEAPAGRVPDSDQWEMNLLAAKRAIEDSGIDKAEIDVVISTGTMVYNRPRHHVQLCEQLGLPLTRYTENSAMGGSAPTANLSIPPETGVSAAPHANASRPAAQPANQRIVFISVLLQLIERLF